MASESTKNEGSNMKFIFERESILPRHAKHLEVA